MRTLTKLVVLLVVGVVAVVGGVFALDRLGVLGSNRESRNSEVISAVTREQQVVLLSLGIQGIDVEKDNADLWGWDVPGTGRASFLQYTFDAKLGIEGEAVAIERTGERSYLVTIPEFVFIGHDNESFETVVEDNGVLSFATAEIDTAAAITDILDSDTKAEYLEKNADLMRDQAEVFYGGIIRGIDSSLEVEYEFAAD